jgi:TolA-binding protein
MKKRFVYVFPLLLIFINCSSISDEDLYNSAQNKITNEDYEGALNDFKQLINEFPESKLYSESLFEIGKLYHGWAVKNISQKESLKNAVEYYQKVFNTEPTGKNAEQSLFMVGFLQANELNQLEEAKRTYNKFIEQFPASELVSSAQAELDNLGIPPEEILKKSEQNL